MTDLEQDFLRVVLLAGELEGEVIPPRVTLRLSKAFSMAVEKAFAIGWLKTDEVDPAKSNPSVLRAAERGVRDYLPV